MPKIPKPESLALWEQGADFDDAGNSNQAVDAFSRAIQNDPEWALPYFWRAQAYEGLGMLLDATDDWSAFIKINGTDNLELLAEAYAGRGYAAKLQGNYEQSISDYSAELRLNPASAIGHLDRSLAYDALGDSTRAVADYKKAISMDPSLEKLVDGRPRVRAFDPSGRDVRIDPKNIN